MDKIKKITLTPACCGLDLGDGSERAEYVNQDYILNTLGRPHRNIGIMYTYYPKDKEWPERISVACKDMEIHFSGIIRMMITSRIAEVRTAIQRENRLSRCAISAVMVRTWH